MGLNSFKWVSSKSYEIDGTPPSFSFLNFLGCLSYFTEGGRERERGVIRVTDEQALSMLLSSCCKGKIRGKQINEFMILPFYWNAFQEMFWKVLRALSLV